MSQEGGDNCEYQLVVGCTHEALDKCVTCKKNEDFQTHEDFIPFNKLDVKDLPEEYTANQVVLDVICDLALLAVQLDVNYISIHRPLDGFGVDPNLRGKRAIIKGSGSVIAVKEKTLTTRKTQCPRECSAPDGDQFCGYFVVATAAHVVFDDDEAANTSVVVFFHDSQKTNLIEKCHGVSVQTTSKEGDFTEMLCVTHNSQFFNHLYKHVENMSDVSKKVPDTYDIELKFVLHYMYEQTVENCKRRPDDVAFPREFPTGICYTFDNSLFCFPKCEQAKSVLENLALGRCAVTSGGQGVKVKGNPELINKSQLSGACKKTEMFLLSLNDSFLIMCTKQYHLYIIGICSEIYMYKGIFTADWKDDGSVQLCRKTYDFPLFDPMEGFDLFERLSPTWLTLLKKWLENRDPWIDDYIFFLTDLGGRTFPTTKCLVREILAIAELMSDGDMREEQIIKELIERETGKSMTENKSLQKLMRESLIDSFREVLVYMMRKTPEEEREMLEDLTLRETLQEEYIDILHCFWRVNLQGMREVLMVEQTLKEEIEKFKDMMRKTLEQEKDLDCMSTVTWWELNKMRKRQEEREMLLEVMSERQERREMFEDMMRETLMEGKEMLVDKMRGSRYRTK